MGTAAIQSKMEEAPLVAPIWHTIVYLALWGALVFGLSAAKPEGHRASSGFPHLDRSWIYLLGFAAEGMAFGLMYLGLRIRKTVFAVVHGLDQSVGELASRFVVGGFLGFLAVQRKSLLPGMIAHGCLNGVAAVILGLSRLAG